MSWKAELTRKDGFVRTLILYRLGSAYSIYYAKEGTDGVKVVRNCIKYLCDIATGITEELPADELTDFLTVMKDTIEMLRDLLKTFLCQS